MVMSRRERVLTTLKHQEPDRVPIDLGGTDVSSIMIGPYRDLCQHLGLDVEPIRVIDIAQQLPKVHDKLKAALDIDVVGVYQLPKDWREGRAYDGTEVLYPAKFRSELTSDGSRVVRNEYGQVELVMPAGSYYYDQVYHPLQDISDVAEIEKAADVIANYDRPAWLDLEWEQLAEHAKHLRETTDAVLVGQFIGHIFQAAQFIRGWEEFMLDLAVNPALAEALMERLCEAHVRAFDRYAQTAGQYVDIIEVCDDLGMQDRLWLSPQSYRKLVKPYHAKLYQHIKANCNALLMMHSDGSLFPVIPDLIEIGVDILNPVQFTAADMELGRLKREFGADLCFWGGGVDTQKTLPFGTPEQVTDEVKRCIDDLASGGGFVFAAVHNIQEGVPVENILAAFRTAAEYGRY